MLAIHKLRMANTCEKSGRCFSLITTELTVVALDAQSQSFHVLDPEAFRSQLGSDFGWAKQNVPFFEVDESDITTAYFFRWKVYRW